MIMKYIVILRPAFIVLLKTVCVAVLAKFISQAPELEPCLCPGLQHTVQSECLDKYEPTAAERALIQLSTSCPSLSPPSFFKVENEGD